ncbi:MAG: Crp/Fnr family transcriptional regulator [Bacteroidota bacterium]
MSFGGSNLYDQIISTITQQVPFDAEAFEAFAARLTAVKLRKHEIWEAEGGIGTYAGFVNQGVLRRYSVKDGDEYTEQFFAEGDFVGNYISYLEQTPAKASIDALEEAHLLVLPFTELQALYQTYPVIQQFAQQVGDQKASQLQARTASLLRDSPMERYEAFMREHPGLALRIPQYYVAQYLGVRPETLSRLRKRSVS